MLSPYIDCISASNAPCRILLMQLTTARTVTSPLKPHGLPYIISKLTAFYDIQ